MRKLTLLFVLGLAPQLAAQEEELPADPTPEPPAEEQEPELELPSQPTDQMAEVIEAIEKVRETFLR